MRPEKEACACEECGDDFDDRRAFNAHQRRFHTKVKLFECDVCGQKSTKMSNLKVHMLIHSGEKRFKCEQCGRLFARAPDLRKHMRVHTGEKPYECEECGRRFAQSSLLYGHKCGSDATRKRAAPKPKLRGPHRRCKRNQTESSSSDDDYSPERRRAPADQERGTNRSEHRNRSPTDDGSRLKRARGRPRKTSPANDPMPSIKKHPPEPCGNPAKELKRGRGRPKKVHRTGRIKKLHSAPNTKEIRDDDHLEEVKPVDTVPVDLCTISELSYVALIKNCSTWNSCNIISWRSAKTRMVQLRWRSGAFHI